MNTPSLGDIKASNPDGSMHNELRVLLGQIITQLQQNLSNEGYKLPQLSTAQITQLNTDKSKTALVYNHETDEAFVNINGTFKKILTA